MPQSSPYQPILLRISHSAIALSTILAIGSGFWVYNTYDKRWGGLPLPKLDSVQDIHGTISVGLLLILPVFALYSFHIGYRRLLQEQSLTQLKQAGKQIGTPIWWISIHHFANTFMLLALTFAVLTGRMMKEAWLPSGEINQPWYLAHLVSWLIVVISLALHLLMGIKVGGVPLLVSMFNWKRRNEDTPNSWFHGLRINHSDWILKVIEGCVIGGILLALILPALKF